jgi:hypothetical protein
MIILILASLLAPVASAQSNWRIDDLSGRQLGNNSETTFVVNLTSKEGTPLTPENLADTAFKRYRYNATTEAEEGLQNLYSSYWFGREAPSTIEGSFVEYEASGDAEGTFNSDQEANTTTNYDIGNLTPVILTNTSERLRPGEEASFSAFVQNSSGDNLTDSVGVELNITDFKTGRERNKPLPRSAGTDRFEVDAKVFDRFNSSFYLEVFAENEAGEVGEASSIIRTLPELDGELKSLESERCRESDSLPELCQPNSTLIPLVSVNQGNASEVNATLLSGRDEELVLSQELQPGREGNYTGSINVPLVNTSLTTENMTLRINVSTQEQSFILEHQFNYSAFELADNTPRGPYLSDPTVEKEVRRPITNDPVTPENLSGNFTVFDPNGQVVEDLTLAEMQYRTGQYVSSVDVVEEGEYETVFEVKDQFGANRSLNSTFEYTPSSITFQAPEEKEVERNKTGEVPFSFEVENNREETLKLNFSVSGELSDNISFVSGQNVSVGPENQTEIGFNVSGSELFARESVVGISENLTDYARDLNLTVTSECADSELRVVEDDLCHSRPDLDATIDTDSFTELEVKYAGEYDSTQRYQFNVTGNASDIASLSTGSLVLGGNYSNDSATLNLTYDPQIPGFYSGELTSDSGDGTVTQSDLSLVTELEEVSIDVQLPGSVDIGIVPRGGSTETSLELTNTGQAPFEIADVSSDNLDVEAPSETVGVDETQSATLSFSEVSASDGTVDIVFEGGGSQIERQVSVSSELIPDYDQRVPDLIEEADRKERQSPSPSPELGTARTRLQDARAEFNQGNYQEARSLFTQAKTTVEEFEPSRDTRGTGTSEPGDTSGTTDGGEASQTTNGSGGGGGLNGLLVGGAVLLVMLLVGFVAVTSIELEPGDPLYGVFGS